jgi:hypothetical protein
VLAQKKNYCEPIFRILEKKNQYLGKSLGYFLKKPHITCKNAFKKPWKLGILEKTSISLKKSSERIEIFMKASIFLEMSSKSLVIFIKA